MKYDTLHVFIVCSLQVTNSSKYGRTCRLDYWWPDVPGVCRTINDSQSYLKPFETVWREGRDKIVPRQGVDNIFYVFQAPAEDVSANRVKIPREARLHFISQGTLDNWRFVLDLGEE